MANIEPDKLQKLADGELDLEQTQQVLMTAEGNPAAWREIACAMVENQIFQKGFVQFAQSTSSQSVDAASEPIAPTQPSFDSSPTYQTASDQTIVESCPIGQHSRRSRIPLHNLALAAGLITCLVIGYLVGSSEAPNVDGRPSVANNPSKNHDSAVNPENLDNSQLTGERTDSTSQISPVSYVEFETPNGEAPQGQVPLYRPRDFKRLIGEDEDKEMNQQMIVKLLPQSGVSEDVRSQLKRSGYHHEVEVKYVSGNLDDGSKFVVPVRTIRWLPGN